MDLALGQPVKAAVRLALSDDVYAHARQGYWRLWDLWHGVETSRFADISRLSVVGPNRIHAVNYEAFGTIRPILKELPIDSERYAFVDLGSGKGRILLEACGFRFKSVEGVEFSPELHRIAETNIKQYRFAKRRSGTVKSTLADAADFEFPNTPLVVYMFNPFSRPVLTTVVDNLLRSAVTHARDILVICTGSLRQKDVFEKTAKFQVVWRRRYSTVYRWSQQEPANTLPV